MLPLIVKNRGRRMNELIRIATADLVRFLAAKLPDFSPDWWQQQVVDRLSFQQQRMVQERGFQTLQQLDFAALLRVVDQNWYELASANGLPREGRTWVKELQTVRNKWAHLSAEAMPDSEIYRDADTLGRLLTALNADPASLKAVDSVKAAALAAMAGKDKAILDDKTEPSESPARNPRTRNLTLPFPLRRSAPGRCSRSAMSSRSGPIRIPCYP